MYKDWSSAHALQGASVVWHYSLLLMHSFNKTEADVFSCRLCFLKAFPFISLIAIFVRIWSINAQTEVSTFTETSNLKPPSGRLYSICARKQNQSLNKHYQCVNCSYCTQRCETSIAENFALPSSCIYMQIVHDSGATLIISVDKRCFYSSKVGEQYIYTVLIHHNDLTVYIHHSYEVNFTVRHLTALLLFFTKLTAPDTREKVFGEAT